MLQNKCTTKSYKNKYCTLLQKHQVNYKLPQSIWCTRKSEILSAIDCCLKAERGVYMVSDDWIGVWFVRLFCCVYVKWIINFALFTQRDRALFSQRCQRLFVVQKRLISSIGLVSVSSWPIGPIGPSDPRPWQNLH